MPTPSCFGLSMKKHIVSLHASWKSKPAVLATLPKDMNLGQDSFVFVDDSAAECAMASGSLPHLRVVQLPPLPKEGTRSGTASALAIGLESSVSWYASCAFATDAFMSAHPYLCSSFASPDPVQSDSSRTGGIASQPGKTAEDSKRTKLYQDMA